MSKLAEAIASETERTRGPQCGTGRLLAALPKPERDDLEAALVGPAPGTLIARALQKLGHNVAAHSIARHRRGDCGCGKS